MIDTHPSLTFGSWVDERRRSLHLDIQQLGQRSGVDPSSISRIQLERTQATLPTAIRLCRAFQISPHELLQQLRAMPHDHALVRCSDQPSAHVLRECDVQAFTLFVRTHIQAGRTLFVSLLRDVATMDVHSEATGLSNMLDMDHVDPETWISQRTRAGNDIPYPWHIKEQTLLDTYLQGGVLLLKDVGAYMKARRRRRGISLVDAQRALSISDSALSRLEAGTIGRLKLRDILVLDEYLAHGGEILGMFWRAVAFHMSEAANPDTSTTRWTPEESQQAELLITLYRWATYFNRDSHWLVSLQQSVTCVGIADKPG